MCSVHPCWSPPPPNLSLCAPTKGYDVFKIFLSTLLTNFTLFFHTLWWGAQTCAPQKLFLEPPICMPSCSESVWFWIRFFALVSIISTFFLWFWIIFFAPASPALTSVLLPSLAASHMPWPRSWWSLDTCRIHSWMEICEAIRMPLCICWGLKGRDGGNSPLY